MPGFLVALGSTFFAVVQGAFHPVDLTTTQDDTEPDRNLTDSSGYIKSWIVRVYSPLGEKVTQADVLTGWDYNTNITTENQADTVWLFELLEDEYD